MRRCALCLALAGVLSACTSGEYQEDLHVDVDGSGDIRIRAYEDTFAIVYGEYDDEAALTERFESPNLHVLSVKHSRREGRGFLQLDFRFDDVNLLSRVPAFQERRYRLVPNNESLDLFVGLRHARKETAPERLSTAVVRFRVHFPSPVRYHNSKSGIERGNVITWELSAADYLQGEPVLIEARFDRRTVLAMTARLLAAALGLVIVVIAASAYTLTRIGRRQLDADRADALRAPPGR